MVLPKNPSEGLPNKPARAYALDSKIINFYYLAVDFKSAQIYEDKLYFT